jgi:porphobilinogen synthase
MHGFLELRPRRLRLSSNLRRMTRETTLQTSDFVYPLFVRPGSGVRKPIASMPGQHQLSVDEAAKEARDVARDGIPAVILFGIPDRKDAVGSDNYNPEGIVPRAIRAIKEAAPDLVVVSDMCFCEYTDHGHCGIINKRGDANYNPRLPEGYLLNDPTLEILAKASVVHGRSGADIIAPSGMIDGMVGAIRRALDGENLEHVAIMSYAAKYASGFYGPFREAAHPDSATEASTRWIRETAGRPSRRSSSTPRRAPTFSWSNPRCPIWTSSLQRGSG